MKQKKSFIVFPVALMVGIIALLMLKKDYSEIDLSIRLLISLGAAIFSGIITFFLFPNNEQK